MSQQASWAMRAATSPGRYRRRRCGTPDLGVLAARPAPGRTDFYPYLKILLSRHATVLSKFKIGIRTGIRTGVVTAVLRAVLIALGTPMYTTRTGGRLPERWHR